MLHLCARKHSTFLPPLAPPAIKKTRQKWEENFINSARISETPVETETNRKVEEKEPPPVSDPMQSPEIGGLRRRSCRSGTAPAPPLPHSGKAAPPVPVRRPAPGHQLLVAGTTLPPPGAPTGRLCFQTPTHASSIVLGVCAVCSCAEVVRLK